MVEAVAVRRGPPAQGEELHRLPVVDLDPGQRDRAVGVPEGVGLVEAEVGLVEIAGLLQVGDPKGHVGKPGDPRAQRLPRARRRGQGHGKEARENQGEAHHGVGGGQAWNGRRERAAQKPGTLAPGNPRPDWPSPASRRAPGPPPPARTRPGLSRSRPSRRSAAARKRREGSATVPRGPAPGSSRRPPR